MGVTVSAIIFVMFGFVVGFYFGVYMAEDNDD